MTINSRLARVARSSAAGMLLGLLVLSGSSAGAAWASPIPSAETAVPVAAAPGTSQDLQRLFAQAKQGSTIRLGGRAFALASGSTIELPRAQDVTVDATGSAFTITGSPKRSVSFVSVMGEGLTWRGGTFTSDGVARLGFSMIQAKRSSFSKITFNRVQGFSHHVFDLMANDGVLIEGCTFTGYGNRLQMDGLTPHNRYAEAVQIDASTEKSSGSAMHNQMLLERGGSFKPQMSKNVTVRGSKFQPAYDAAGKMIAWGPQPFGQHAQLSQSRNENIVFEKNTVIEPIPADGEKYEAPLHFPPVRNLSVTGNVFRTSVRHPAWIQLFNATTQGPYTADVTISGNRFEGVPPTLSYVALDVAQWSRAGNGAAISDVEVTGNQVAPGRAPMAASRGAVVQVERPVVSDTRTPLGGEQAPNTGIRPAPLPPQGSTDFTGDQRSDLVAVDSQGKLWIYPGNGSGRFQARKLIGSGWSGYRVIAVSDANGDGKSDVLAARNTDGKLWLYPGNGRGGVGARTLMGAGFAGYRNLTSPGDLTGDGISDVVGVHSRTGELHLWQLTGRSSSIAKHTVISAGWKAYDVSSIPSRTSGGTAGLIAKNRSTGELWLYPSIGGGRFSSRVQLGKTGWQHFRLVSVGDWNGDGRSDLIAHDTRYGLMWMYQGAADGTLGIRTQIGTGWNGMRQLG